MEPSQPTSTTNGDKGPKIKRTKTNKHCKFCEQYGHLESNCFTNIESLEVAMKKKNINCYPDSSKSSSHEHALFPIGFFFNATSTSFDEILIDSGESCHMAKDKSILSTLNECNTKKIFIGDDRSLSFVGSRKV